jgi:hypothetical protein
MSTQKDRFIAVNVLVVDGPKKDGKPGPSVEVKPGQTFDSDNADLVKSLLAQGAIRPVNPPKKFKPAVDADGKPVSPAGYAVGVASAGAVVSDPNAPDADQKAETIKTITDGAADDGKTDGKAGGKK